MDANNNRILVKVAYMYYDENMTQQEIADKLQLLVKAKYNIFISGGTGSGKTTFLNALSNYIPKDERVITIEDSAELQIEGIDNLVSLETRNANASEAVLQAPMIVMVCTSCNMVLTPSITSG